MHHLVACSLKRNSRSIPISRLAQLSRPCSRVCQLHSTAYAPLALRGDSRKRTAPNDVDVSHCSRFSTAVLDPQGSEGSEPYHEQLEEPRHSKGETFLGKPQLPIAVKRLYLDFIPSYPTTPISTDDNFKRFVIPPRRSPDVSAPKIHLQTKAQYVPTVTSADSEAVATLDALVADRSSTPDKIYEAYKQLHRLNLLTGSQINKLLNRLAVFNGSNRQFSKNYCTVMMDILEHDLPLRSGKWNSYIYHSARQGLKITPDDVTSALRSWAVMEDKAKFKANHVTFSILFDIAMKADRFSLAEVIFSEMKAQGLDVNRYLRTAQICFHGYKGEGAAIRNAYKTLVDAGDIIDTVVLNCLLSALLRAGEPATAAYVFDQMKSMYQLYDKMALPPAEISTRREAAEIFERAVQEDRTSPMTPELYRYWSVAPDLYTFRIWFKHFAYDSGDFERIPCLLMEMADYQLAPDDNIFSALFKGFILHGGIRYSDWTLSRLDNIWSRAKVAKENGKVKFTKRTISRAIRAFEECASPRRASAMLTEAKALFPDLWRAVERADERTSGSH